MNYINIKTALIMHAICRESAMEVGDAEVDVHETFLGGLCRVCGDKLQKAKSRSTSFVCNTHQADLKSGFSIDVD